MIFENYLIGAGSVVTKKVPDYALVYGNPAKIQSYICECGHKLKFNGNIAQCKCGRKYKLVDDKIMKT